MTQPWTVALPAAVVLIAAAALPASAGAGVTLTTATTRFRLTSPQEGLRLRSLADLATGTELVPLAEGGTPLWEIVLRDPQRELLAVEPGPGAELSATRDEQDARVYRLRWPRLDLPDEPGALSVEVTVTLPPGSGLSYWRIEVTNRSATWGAWEVRFPRLARLGPVGPPEEDRFLDPLVQGRLTPHPYRNLPRALYVRDAPVQSAGHSVHYPGYASFQMCALYHPQRAGLYYAAYDSEGYYKHFSFGATEQGEWLDLYLTHFPEEQGRPGTGYRSPFPVAVGTFAGDWFSAAKLYRQWAQEQVWCAAGPLERRADVPQWYKDLATWEFLTETNYARMHRYRELMGLPVANHWNYLWKHPGQGDHGSPDLFPPRGGEEQMRREVQRLTEAELYTVPYFLSSAVDTKSPQYAEWEMDPVLVRYDSGEPYMWIYNAGTEQEVRFAWPCPHLDFWPDRVEGIIRRIMELGVSGVYLDTTTGNAFQCFSAEHGHPVGGGNYWAQGNRRLLERIRRTIRQVNPRGIMTGENPCEIYLDLVDGFLMFTAHFPTSVPAFQAIYGDYTCTYGQSLATAAVVGQDYPFTLPVGISFIHGDQLGWFSRTDHTMSPQGAADLAWLRRLAHFRAKSVHRYLALGEMLRAPRLESLLPQISGWWWDWDPQHWLTRTVSRPAVVHGAWRAPEGSVGLIFVNLSEQPQRVAFHLEGPDYGFAPGAELEGWVLGLDEQERATRERWGPLPGGRARVEHTLEPRGLWALEVGPPTADS